MSKSCSLPPSLESLLPTIASRVTPLRFGALELKSDHPLAPLGRLGVLKKAEANPEAFSEVIELVNSYKDSLKSHLEASFEQADALEKRWSNEGEDVNVFELLRASFRGLNSYPQILDAIERCEKVLSHYATPHIAFGVLTLELRQILRP
ncbi:MAG: hypothetical protein R2880_19460 [Deinococcales bacterium]